MPRRIEVDIDNLCRLYDSGESVKSLANILGISRPCVVRRLKEVGRTPRNRSESMFLRMSKTSPEERLRLSEAAHASVRGKTQSFETRCKIALARESRGGCDSVYESSMFDWLVERGLSPVPQKAIGPYNVDLAIDESRIAVELFGGDWHATGRHAARFRHRTDYILGQGWIPVFIWAQTGWAGKIEFSDASAEYVVALHKIRCAGKSSGCQEHVIRGDGYTTPVAKHNPHNGALVLGVSRGNERRHTDGRFT